jgi:hypothetical protein
MLPGQLSSAFERTRATNYASDGHSCVRTQNVRSSANASELAKTCEM